MRPRVCDARARSQAVLSGDVAYRIATPRMSIIISLHQSYGFSVEFQYNSPRRRGVGTKKSRQATIPRKVEFHRTRLGYAEPSPESEHGLRQRDTEPSFRTGVATKRTIDIISDIVAPFLASSVSHP